MNDFDLSGVAPKRRRAADLRTINNTIESLAARRKPEIRREGPFAKSKIAWKVATYQQAVLYRVVALARGTREAWNARNLLATFLTARALVETVAVFDEFARVLLAHAANENLKEIDALLTNRIFATRDEELLQTHPELQAINVLTLIEKLQKRYDLPIRSNYDNLSERCHPNSLGHHQMFSKTDYGDGTVTFSETKSLERILDVIRAPLGLVFLFENAMNELDGATLSVADIQHRISPVK